jgi:hypothetical protein
MAPWIRAMDVARCAALKYRAIHVDALPELRSVRARAVSAIDRKPWKGVIVRSTGFQSGLLMAN